MSYSTVDQVRAEFKDITFKVDPTAPGISLDDVASFQDEFSAIIDSYVSKKYVLPIPMGGASSKILRFIEIVLVSERIKKIIAVKSPDDEKNQDGLTDKEKKAWGMLEKISTGNLILPDATTTSFSVAFSDYNSQHHIEPYFDVTKDQW